ncbi:hypothetical protein ACH5RR_018205 [Cinchona calisaya]|uniref:Reverse transcriptase RNase H-like domain-containing protein n=1 Tax=Cinchona calisaya TaxID=153742 RepID=A0ABD2ZKS5_9GENT
MIYQHSFFATEACYESYTYPSLTRFSKLFLLEIDASQKAVGVVLMQQGQPIAYMSQVLGGKNQFLSIYEKELLSLITADNKWRPLSLGSQFIIRTDHRNLKYLLDQKYHNFSPAEMADQAYGLDYEKQCKKGKENIVADALSRKEEGNVVGEASCVVNAISRGAQVADDLSQLSSDGLVEPLAMLDRRAVTKRTKEMEQVLIHWENLEVEDVTLEID